MSLAAEWKRLSATCCHMRGRDACLRAPACSYRLACSATYEQAVPAVIHPANCRLFKNTGRNTAPSRMCSPGEIQGRAQPACSKHLPGPHRRAGAQRHGRAGVTNLQSPGWVRSSFTRQAACLGPHGFRQVRGHNARGPRRTRKMRQGMVGRGLASALRAHEAAFQAGIALPGEQETS